jgi:hypothetical protein
MCAGGLSFARREQIGSFFAIIPAFCKERLDNPGGVMYIDFRHLAA